MNGYGNARFEECIIYLSLFIKEGICYLSLSFQCLLSIRHSGCKRITIIEMHHITVIPIMSVHSALTWQVTVCLCACLCAVHLEKSENTYNVCAERCVKYKMHGLLGVFGGSIEGSMNTG